MKFDNNNLLEQIIRDTLFEVTTSSTKIIPWTGNKLSRKTAKFPGAVAGFTVIVTGDDLSKQRIIADISKDSNYGESSQFANGRFIYITSKPNISTNKTTYNVTIFDDLSKYYTTDLIADYQKNYNLIPDSIKRKYNLPDVKVFTSPYVIGDSDFIFNDDISKREQFVDSLATQITLMANIGPEYTELGMSKLDLEKRVKELETQLQQKKNQSDVVIPVPTETDEYGPKEKPEDDTPTPVLPIEIQYPITKNSDSAVIRQLQQDIIEMIDNNPEIYPDPGTLYKSIFDRFTKTYRADGKWGTNTNNMIKLINVGFNDTESTNIDKSTYDLIRKYQTEKIEL